jgi:hypothetical protein
MAARAHAPIIRIVGDFCKNPFGDLIGSGNLEARVAGTASGQSQIKNSGWK